MNVSGWGRKSTLQLYNTQECKPLLLDNNISKVNWGSSNLLASTTRDGIIKIYRWKSSQPDAKCLRQEKHDPSRPSEINNLKFSPNERLLVSTRDNSLCLWDVSKPPSQGVRKLYLNKVITSIQFSPLSTRYNWILAVGDTQRNISFWHINRKFEFQRQGVLRHVGSKPEYLPDAAIASPASTSLSSAATTTEIETKTPIPPPTAPAPITPASSSPASHASSSHCFLADPLADEKKLAKREISLAGKITAIQVLLDESYPASDHAHAVQRNEFQQRLNQYAGAGPTQQILSELDIIEEALQEATTQHKISHIIS